MRTVVTRDTWVQLFTKERPRRPIIGVGVRNNRTHGHLGPLKNLLGKTALHVFNPFRSSNAYKCQRPMGGGTECGMMFSKLQDLKDHRGDCVWKCPVVDCGRSAKKTRAIEEHQAKHRADDARRTAVVSLMGDNLIS